MSYPLPTFIPQDEADSLCETYLHGELLRADSPALLAEAVFERLFGRLPE